jgi:hypothetical protein
MTNGYAVNLGSGAASLLISCSSCSGEEFDGAKAEKGAEWGRTDPDGGPVFRLEFWPAL